MSTRKPLFIAVVAALALSWAATVTADPGGRFPATGQTTCWDSSGNTIPCSGTGQDGEIQAGATLRYRDNGDGTISDRTTKLMWEKKSDDGSIHDVDRIYTWKDAFEVHVATLNATNFAGYNDWRLPNYKELMSILDLGNAYPAVSPAFNTNCVPNVTVLDGSCTATSVYWSSTTVASRPILAWWVDFTFGIGLTFGKQDVIRVRAVRGGSP